MGELIAQILLWGNQSIMKIWSRWRPIVQRTLQPLQATKPVLYWGHSRLHLCPTEMFLFDCVFHVSADLRTFQRSPSYTAAVQGQERKRHTVTSACVCGVRVCALARGLGLDLSETSPPYDAHTHTHTSKVTQSAQTPSLEQFSPSNSQCRVPSCF